MPVPLAELFISVSADVSAAISGLQALNTQVNGTTNAFAQARPAALLFASAGAAIGAGFVSSVKVAADFEKQMSGVRAVLAPEDVQTFGKALDSLALKLGADTTFSAREAAAGIEELVKLGVPAEAVLGGAAKAALDLAAATGADVPTAATLAAQALNAFHLSLTDLPKVVDTLAGVSNVTAADMNDLKLGFSDVAAVAHGLGLSFVDTATAIGIFRDNGLTGNTAGTALKVMLQNLQPQTKAQTALFRNLGLVAEDGSNAFFDSAGHVRDLASVAGVLQKALGGMTDQQRDATLTTIFGTQAVQAANILFGTGAAGVKKYVDEIQKVSAADQAAERLNNFAGRLEQLAGSLETAQIIVGKLFLPTLGKVADTVKGVVNAFSNMSPEAQGVVVAFSGVAGVLASMIGGIVLLTPVVKLLAPSFAAVGRVLVSLVPFFRIATLVMAVLFAAWQTNLFGIRDLVQTAFDRIPDILESVGGAFKRASEFWSSTILPTLQAIAVTVERSLIPVLNAIITNPFFVNFGLVFQKALNGDVQGAVDTFIAIIGAVAPGLGPVIQNVRTLMTGFLATLTPVLTNLGLVFQKLFAGDFVGALDTFRAIVGAVAPDLTKALAPAVGFATGAGQKVGVAFSLLGSGIDAILAGKGDILEEFFKTKLPDALNEFQNRLGGLGPSFTTVAGFFSALGVAMDSLTTENVAQAMEALSGRIQVALKSLGTDLAPFVATFVAVGNFLSATTELLLTLQATTAKAGAGGDAQSLVAPFQALVDFMRENQKFLQDSFVALTPGFNVLREAAGFFDAMATAIRGLTAAVKEARTSGVLPDWLANLLGGNLQGATGSVLDNPSGVPIPLPGSAQFLKSAFNPGGAGGGVTNIITINSGPITGEGDEQRLAERIAAAIGGAANRVTTPPDNSSFPSLVGGVI